MRSAPSLFPAQPKKQALCRRAPPGRRLRLGHPFPHLRLIASRLKLAPRCIRVIEEGLDFLAYYLLDKHEVPEFVLEPIEVLLRAVFRPSQSRSEERRVGKDS